MKTHDDLGFASVETGPAILLGAVLGGLFSAASFILLAGRYKVARRLKQGRSLLEDLKETQEEEARLIDETMAMLSTQKQAIAEARTEGQGREQRFQDFMTRAERALDGGREIWTKIERRDQQLEVKAQELEQLSEELEQRRQSLDARELEFAGWTEEQAREAWFDRLRADHRSETQSLLQAEKLRLEEQRQQLTQTILITAMQRQAIEQGLEACLETLELPSESFKMRLVGREGRNARTFQRVTGVDLIIDETPGFVLLSSFDPLRRAIAAKTLELLFVAGPIHPTRIEEANQQAQQWLDAEALATGRRVCRELQIGPVAEEIATVVGRLNYFRSYGQNLLQHSLEVARLASHIAAELGFKTQLIRRCGLLHDLGRALEQDLELAHDQAGAEFAKQFGETEQVCRVISEHHKLGQEEPLIQILQSADRLSAERPGARSESIDKHTRRLAAMEKIASEFSNVLAAYAFDAGSELKVFVNGRKIYGRLAQKMARDIALKIENETVPPGPVRVSVVSEVEVVEAIES